MQVKFPSLILLLMLLSCGTQLRVFTDFAPETSPAFFYRFDWKIKGDVEVGKNPVLYNEFNDQRIKAAVNRELTSRGYKLDESNPTLLAHYHIVLRDQPLVSFPYDYNYSNSEYWISRHSISSYKEGTLILDFVDAKTNKLIWRGWAIAVLDDAYGPEMVSELITLSVTRIMKEFPKYAGLDQNPVDLTELDKALLDPQ